MRFFSLPTDLEGPLLTAALTRRSVLLGILSTAIFTLRPAIADLPAKFIGDVLTKWSIDGRHMELLGPFEFVQSSGRRWPVPAGTIVDGASIPQVFWSIIGGPFEGQYRAPSVIHDYYCDTRTRKYADVHRIFYEGMLVAGVSASKAWLMYRAVATFGPKWDDPKIDPKCETVDSNYDFDACARNFPKPPVQVSIPRRSDLESFATSLQNEVDPGDLITLRKAIQTAPE